MTVKELIEFLQTQPQDLPVVYRSHSEYDLLDVKYIHIKNLCIERPDGWVANQRPDKKTKKYLAFPGN